MFKFPDGAPSPVTSKPSWSGMYTILQWIQTMLVEYELVKRTQD
jgi:hypothetical protein